MTRNVLIAVLPDRAEGEKRLKIKIWVTSTASFLFLGQTQARWLTKGIRRKVWESMAKLWECLAEWAGQWQVIEGNLQRCRQRVCFSPTFVSLYSTYKKYSECKHAQNSVCRMLCCTQLLLKTSLFSFCRGKHSTLARLSGKKGGGDVTLAQKMGNSQATPGLARPRQASPGPRDICISWRCGTNSAKCLQHLYKWRGIRRFWGGPSPARRRTNSATSAKKSTPLQVFAKFLVSGA